MAASESHGALGLSPCADSRDVVGWRGAGSGLHRSGQWQDASRPQLEAALAYVREGDTLVVHSMHRLARNLEDLRRPGAAVRELPSR